jgi:hypothetical protein
MKLISCIEIIAEDFLASLLINMNADNADSGNKRCCWICYGEGPDEEGQQLMCG